LLDGAVQWLDLPPPTMEGLRGKVVLIDFWTCSCFNCLRALPCRGLGPEVPRPRAHAGQGVVVVPGTRSWIGR